MRWLRELHVEWLERREIARARRQERRQRYGPNEGFSPRSARMQENYARATAARDLAGRELWPAPHGLRGWWRRLLGRPMTTGSDELTMRVDANRVAQAIATSEDPPPLPHPGLVNLAHRSERRIVERCIKPGRRLANSLARTTAAQTALDSADYERNAAAGAIADLPEQPPRPRFGTALTQGASVWIVLLTVMIPLESFLTYRQLLVLGMSDSSTRALSVLIGLALIVVAEVAGLLLYYLMSHPDDLREQAAEDHEEELRIWLPRSFRYWVVAALTLVTIGVGVVTLDRLAVAREHNQGILDAQINRQLGREAQFKAQTGLGSSESSGAGGALKRQQESGNIDLTWTFWLQFLAFLTAIAIALRRREAHDFNDFIRDRNRRTRAARLAERRMQRSNRRLTAATSRYEATMRNIRARHEQERALLLELFDRVRAQSLNVEPRLVPRLEDIETVISRTLAPHLEPLGQPTVASVPLPDPPPPPRSSASRPPFEPTGQGTGGSGEASGGNATPADRPPATEGPEQWVFGDQHGPAGGGYGGDRARTTSSQKDDADTTPFGGNGESRSEFPVQNGISEFRYTAGDPPFDQQDPLSELAETMDGRAGLGDAGTIDPEDPLSDAIARVYRATNVS
jgi:hypothetical protein